ncbi:MAG: hypothetical protein HKL91_08375 [Candidatus Eremiobacteraeota bacterium]|uniref:Uncharacterized protein n=1 Tax=mine drainage metagenome TaxID=410659 RepID=E6PI88_9ZZZZ|nr:hypothetical protein [Candidatus Eremiobacteraeota bacterium]
MNTKRIIALASFAALVISTAPAFAAPPTVTIDWNTQKIASIVLTTQYNGTPLGSHSTSAETIDANLNTGTGICQTSDTEATTGTINFGNVTPDITQYTDCMELNAVNAAIGTNDSLGYSVTEAATAGYPASGFLLCLLPNGTWANNLAATASARAAAPSVVSTTACPAGDFAMNGTGGTLLSTTAATTGTNLGGDVELVIAPNAPSGVQSVTVTYTLTTN